MQSLENPAAHNAVIELGGPQPLRPLEVVALFEKTNGRPFTVTHVPEEALEEQKQAATDSLQKSFAGLILHYAAGDQIYSSRLPYSYETILVSLSSCAAVLIAGFEISPQGRSLCPQQ